MDHLERCVAIMTLVAFSATAHAQSVVPETQYFGDSRISLTDPVTTPNSVSVVDAVDGEGTFVARLNRDIGPTNVSASATTSLATNPIPSVYAETIASSSPQNAYLSFARASGALTYSFMILGGGENDSVPISVTSAGYAERMPVLGAPGNSSSHNTQSFFVLSKANAVSTLPYGIGSIVGGVGAAACLSSVGCGRVTASGLGPIAEEFQFLGTVSPVEPDTIRAEFSDLVQSTTLFANTIYNVTLVASSEVFISGFRGGGGQRDAAWIDPFIEINPAFNSDGTYTLAFSPGVGNSIAAPVPEPEIYAMMGVGLGVMGWVARRKRKQAVI